jgi:putative transposase
MLANDKLAHAISDVGFGAIRRQLEYKALRYGTQIVIADRWYPSSRLCSCCDWKNEALTLNDREWVCRECGTRHDRDTNAARNLKRLATATALPVANRTATDDAAIGRVPFVAGKVTPVRDEASQQGASGQEMNCAHLRALF